MRGREEEANFSCHYLPHVSAVMLTQKGFLCGLSMGLGERGREREEGRDTHQCMMNACKAPPPSLLAVLWQGGVDFDTCVFLSLNTAFNLHNGLALHLCNLCLRNCVKERR